MNSLVKKGITAKIKNREEILYFRDRGGILIINPAKHKSFLLNGIEAALWDWIQQFKWTEILNMASVYLRIPQKLAEDQLAEILANWRYSGLLELGEE